MNTVTSAAVDDDLWSAVGDPTRRRMLDALIAVGSAWDARLQRIKRLAETIERTQNSTHETSANKTSEKKTSRKGKHNG